MRETSTSRAQRYLRGQQDYDGFLTSSCGQSGDGVYAFPSANSAMTRYYTSSGQALVSIMPLGEVVDLRKNLSAVADACVRCGVIFKKSTWWLQHFALALVMRELFPDAAGYLVPHRGPGIPSGQQIVFHPDRISFSLVS